MPNASSDPEWSLGRRRDLAAPLTSSYTRSITAAMAWPKPMHIVASP